MVPLDSRAKLVKQINLAIERHKRSKVEIEQRIANGTSKYNDEDDLDAIIFWLRWANRWSDGLTRRG